MKTENILKNNSLVRTVASEPEAKGEGSSVTTSPRSYNSTIKNAIIQSSNKNKGFFLIATNM